MATHITSFNAFFHQWDFLYRYLILLGFIRIGENAAHIFFFDCDIFCETYHAPQYRVVTFMNVETVSKCKKLNVLYHQKYTAFIINKYNLL